MWNFINKIKMVFDCKALLSDPTKHYTGIVVGGNLLKIGNTKAAE